MMNTICLLAFCLLLSRHALIVKRWHHHHHHHCNSTTYKRVLQYYVILMDGVMVWREAPSYEDRGKESPSKKAVSRYHQWTMHHYNKIRENESFLFLTILSSAHLSICQWIPCPSCSRAHNIILSFLHPKQTIFHFRVLMCRVDIIAKMGREGGWLIACGRRLSTS